MSQPISRYSAEETARRGDTIYEQELRAQLEPEHTGEVVAIDIETHAYIVADNALTASRQLLAQHPDAEVWCMRIGRRALHRIGAGRAQESA